MYHGSHDLEGQEEALTRAEEEAGGDGAEDIAQHVVQSHQEQQLAQPHHRYKEARERASSLNHTLQIANMQYKKELLEIVNSLRREFLRKYHKELNELDDLNNAIENVQSQGLKHLKQELMKLQMSTDSYEETREKTRQLTQEFQRLYYPRDEYQRQCDREALRLQAQIVPMLGGGAAAAGMALAPEGGGGNNHYRIGY